MSQRWTRLVSLVSGWRLDPFLVPITLVALGTALYRLGDKGLWGDEIWQVWWSVQHPLNIMVSQGWAPPDLPLSFFLTRFATALGTDAFPVRLPQAISAVGTVLVLHALGGRAFGRSVAIAAALLLAMAPLHVWYAQDARPYAGLAFFSLVTLYWFMRLLDGWSWVSWVGLTAAFALAVYNHLFGLFAIAVLVLIAPAWWVRQMLHDGWHGLPSLERGMRSSWRLPVAVWSAGTTAAILCWPILPGIVGYLRAGGQGEVAAPSFTVTPGFLADLLGLYGAGSGWRLVLMASLFGVGLGVAAWRRTSMALIAVAWLAVPFIVLSAAQPEHTFNPRYFLFMQPIYLLLATVGLLAIADGMGVVIARFTPWRQISKGLLAVGAVAIIGAVLLKTTWAGYRVDKQQDWGSVCSFLRVNAEAGDQITGNAHARDALRWCLRADASLFIPARDQPLSELFESGQNVWFIQLDVGPPEPQLDRQRFVRIPDNAWERLDLIEPRLYESFSFPVSEVAAHIYYRPSPVLPTELTLHDVRGATVVAGWPDYAQLGPSDRRSFRLANLPGMSFLQIQFLNDPGRDVQLSLDHILVGTLSTADGDGNWAIASFPIPSTAGAIMLLEMRNIGWQPAAISEIHVSERPTAARE